MFAFVVYSRASGKVGAFTGIQRQMHLNGRWVRKTFHLLPASPFTHFRSALLNSTSAAVVAAVVGSERLPQVRQASPLSRLGPTAKLPVLSRHNPPNTGSAFITWVRIRRTRFLPLHSSSFFIFIYVSASFFCDCCAEEMAFKKMGQEGTPGNTPLSHDYPPAYCIAVPMTYEDLWDALQRNHFEVEQTIEHLMAHMASEGL